MPQGSILFHNSQDQISEDPSNLFYDQTNKRVGIGTSSPSSILHLGPNNGTSHRIKIGGTSSSESGIEFLKDGTSFDGLIYYQGSSRSLRFRTASSIQDQLILDSGGRLLLNTSDPDYTITTWDESNTTQYQAQLKAVNNSQTRAIYAESNATQNSHGAIYGKGTADGGAGVVGETPSGGASGGSSVGVFGFSSYTGSTTGGGCFGVLGRTQAVQGGAGTSVPAGVYGDARSKDGDVGFSGIAHGVQGETWSTDTGSAGVKAALRARKSKGRALWAEVSPSGDGWAGYFDGPVVIHNRGAENAYLVIEEVDTAPPSEPQVGKLYIKSSDGNLYFRRRDGVEIRIS